MINHITIFLLFILPVFSQAQTMDSMKSPFEKNNNSTSTYEEMISFYKDLQTKFPDKLQMEEAGLSDVGLPIHRVYLNRNSSSSQKVSLLINNAIHPGEPCGVDATMMLVRDLLTDPSLAQLLDKVNLCVIPAYNIGGMLNRNSTTRANQDGPESYGFRGNAKNLDLNRDFIKCDSRNAKSFSKIFHDCDPHIMIDNHTSNGADYSYTMTLIATQKDKLHPLVAEQMTDHMLPFLYDDMKNKQWEMTPYVYSKGSPDHGIYGFLDLPRYSSGYASLFHTISFMPETHMLKPYKDRVMSTYAFMISMLNYINNNDLEIIIARKEARAESQKLNSLAIQWELMSEEKDSIMFKGYEAAFKQSHVHGEDRLYYDQSKPYTKSVDFFNHYQAKESVKVPSFYIIPQAYHEIIALLKNNKVEMEILGADTEIQCSQYYIKEYETVNSPYEGHYLHFNVSVNERSGLVNWRKGDVKVPTRQDKIQYIVHTLEPHAADSFFAWNFFDGILMAKEHYSDYVFEDLAASLLEEDKDLKEAFEKKKGSDASFAKDPKAQLNFIYDHSPHREKTYKLYPVAKQF